MVLEIIFIFRKNIGNFSRGILNVNFLKGRYEVKLDRGFKLMEREMGIF